MTLLSPEEPWTLVIPPSWASASWCKQDAPPATLSLAGWPWAPEVTGGKSLPEALLPLGQGLEQKDACEENSHGALCFCPCGHSRQAAVHTRLHSRRPAPRPAPTPASLTAHVLWPGSERALRGFLIPHPGT